MHEHEATKEHPLTAWEPKRETFLKSEGEAKVKLGFELLTLQEEHPSIRDWVTEYLLEKDVVEKIGYELDPLMSIVARAGDRAGVVVARKYWGVKHSSSPLYTTTEILKRGTEHLSPEEKEELVKEGRENYDAIKDDSNALSCFVDIVGSFGSSQDLDWLYSRIEEHPIGPVSSTAFEGARRLDEKGTLKTLLKVLGNLPPEKLYHQNDLIYKILVIQDSIDDHLEATQILKVIDRIISYEGDDFYSNLARNVLTDKLSNSKGVISRLTTLSSKSTD